MFFSLGKKSEKLWQRYSIYLKITNLQISKFALTTGTYKWWGNMRLWELWEVRAARAMVGGVGGASRTGEVGGVGAMGVVGGMGAWEEKIMEK